SAKKDEKWSAGTFWRRVSEYYAPLRESAWLPVALLQHHVADAVLGGVSAATVQVLQHILQAANCREGFELKMGDAKCRVHLAPRAFFLADHDAQRATYCNKGSSGYKPCLWCANVLKRDAPQASTASATFADICESRFSSFQIASDAEIFAAADHLAGIPKAGERATMEKAYGFKFVPGSLLQDAEARQLMPPSAACNDVLHAYFCNGVASWEVGLAMRELQSISDLDALWHLVQEEAWVTTFPHGELKSCFRATLYDTNDGFKGSGTLCWNFVFLLYYLVHQLLHKADLKPAVCRSFFLLKSICAELRIFKSYVGLHQKKLVNDSSRFQIAVLPRMLNVTLRESEENGLLLPPELQKPLRAASSELRAFAGDPELQSGKALRFGKLLIRPQDVIMWDAK
ncbi:unnamed protein product, partial [Symbiodinium microadriaticum]